ncbi:hypothetical protein J7K44_02740 [bacterium]|nr:hypothetical protein [bacterium]
MGRKVVEEEKEKAKWATVRIGCEGTTPILFHNPATRDDIRLRDADDKEKAEACLYKNGKGQIGIPRELLYACLKLGGTMVSINWEGRKTKITLGGRSKGKGGERTSLLYGLLKIREPFIVFNGSEWIVDKRSARNPSTGGMNTVVRARMNKWKFEMTVDFDEMLLPEASLKKLFEVSGRWFGLGAFRIGLGGPFGQFRIIRWKRIN